MAGRRQRIASKRDDVGRRQTSPPVLLLGRAVIDEKPSLARILEKLAELWAQQSTKS